MEYNSAHRTETLYRTAEGAWQRGSYCAVHSVSDQHRRIVSSASEENFVSSSTLRERFQQTRNVGSENDIKRNQGEGASSGWPNGRPDPGIEPKHCGMVTQMHRKLSSNLGNLGSRIYDLASSSIFSRDQGNQFKPRQNIGNADFEVIEHYELTRLQEGDGEGAAYYGAAYDGVAHGHRFVLANLKAPNWCDKCGGFIWGMYKHCFVCINCRYTCHPACRHLVTLDCILKQDGGETGVVAEVETSETCFSDDNAEFDIDDDDSGYFTCRSTTRQSFGCRDRRGAPWTREKLRKRIETFNQNNHGLQMNMEFFEEDVFRGSIRVHMNLIRPITMSVSPNLPSLYNSLTQHTESGERKENGQVISFYLPENTSRVIHISSESTAQEVVRALLSKFNITDNPRKFALYEKNHLNGRKSGVMRRMAVDEFPLPICLSWADGGVDQLDNNMFVLQENDTGEIVWEEFSLPELESFHQVLNREEEEHMEQVREKYRVFKIQLQNQLKQKEMEKGEKGLSGTGKRKPVFV